MYYIGMRRGVASILLICAVLLGGAAAVPANWFEDRTAQSGISTVLRNHPTPEKHQIETMAGGVAVLDYDNDGRPDLFFTNGAPQPALVKSGAGDSNRLYRNLGNWKFEDVTERSGLRGEGYSIAAAAADFDNDGFSDLLVTGVASTHLYRNRGDGSFEDVTARAGVSDTGRWAVSAGWFDYDNDGWLDLFVVNYVKWDPAREPFCGEAGRYRTYCHPRFYEGLPDTLYHNNGDGTFTDVSAKSGIASYTGKGMGVAFADYDNDGRADVFVANDTVPNFLFHNLGGGRFEDVAFPAGVAMNDDGRSLSSMGADFRDMNNDGLPDIFITALANETFPFYRNLGKGLFGDVTYQSRIGAATLAYSGWGAGAYDFDTDGRKDLFAACGDVQDNTERFSGRSSRQAPLLLLQREPGRFEAHEAGPRAQYRGAAFADFDGDGRVDAVLTALGEKPLLLANSGPRTNHWLGLRLTGSQSNRDGIGARVRLVTPSGGQWNQVSTAVGYASASERAVHFGLGPDDRVSRIEIVWPSGKVQNVNNIQADRYFDIREPK